MKYDNGIIMEKGKDYKVAQNKEVKEITYKTGEKEIIDVTNRKNNKLFLYKRVSKDSFINPITGAKEDYNKNEYKSYECLRKSMRNLRKKLRNNFFGNANELFITLTVEKDGIEIADLRKNFKRFIKKLKKDYPDLKYVVVVEKVSLSSRYHMHLIIKDLTKKKLYIPNSEINKLWKIGNTKTERIKNDTTTDGIDKVISYMSKIEDKEYIPIREKCFYSSKNLQYPKERMVGYDVCCKEFKGRYYKKSEYTILLRNKYNNTIVNKIKKESWMKIDKGEKNE